MRSKETVFWLTLVDFLIQVIFFGIFAAVVWFAVTAIARPGEPVEPQVLKPLNPDSSGTPISYAKGAGFQDLAELTDSLSRLVPANEFRSLLALVQEAEGVGNLEPKRPSVANSGQGTGLDRAPCLVGIADKYKSLAKIIVDDTHVEFAELTPQLSDALAALGGIEFEQIRRLPLVDFQRVFGRLQVVDPDCRHYVELEKRYTLAEPLEVVQRVFFIGSTGSSKGPYSKSPQSIS